MYTGIAFSIQSLNHEFYFIISFFGHWLETEIFKIRNDENNMSAFRMKNRFFLRLGTSNH